ncbi:MAG: DNA polymerase III subunit delta' [Betaproteobacteria bacterium]|nr:MAG: DNA polymerase III subunit delta' [Betaproteobacteria bacterium]
MHPWNEALLQRLTHDPAHLPHALLLSGSPGIGKQALAFEMARRLLCCAPTATATATGAACGVCQSCHWFNQGTHPDFRFLERTINEDTGKLRADIQIDQVRDLVGFYSLTAHQHGWRVAVIAPAERMNAAAANGLLKTLEEPPPRSLLILISHHPRRLLATVRSRCQQVAVPLPPREEALAWLATQSIAMPQAADLLDEAGGAPLEALALFSDTARGERVARCVAALAQARIEALLDLAAIKDSVVETHGWLRRWVHDLISQRQVAQVYFFPAHAQALMKLAARADLAKLLALQARLDAETRILLHPLNTQLLMEQWFIDYVGCFNA